MQKRDNNSREELGACSAGAISFDAILDPFDHSRRFEKRISLRQSILALENKKSSLFRACCGDGSAQVLLGAELRDEAACLLPPPRPPCVQMRTRMHGICIPKSGDEQLKQY